MGLISYILGSDSRAAVKKLNKLAVKVEELEPKYQSMSDEQLKDQTRVLKERLAKGETLDDIMFDAFAALREASWRVLKMKHFHVQIMGGICLHQGRIAEMRTGEGKTLVSTLPAYLNALTGKGVHIVTVNDYLARRDAEWMGKVHKFMGLTVGVVVPGMDDRQKKEAYACDIVYGTNNELGFDYLRDNLKVFARRHGAARAQLLHNRRSGLHSHRRGAHPAHHLGQGRRKFESCTRTSTGSCAR